jgi:type I restriction enzyme S subunit
MNEQAKKLVDCISLAKGKPPAQIPFYGEGAEPYLNPEYLRGNAPAELAKPVPNAVRVEEGDTILLWDGSNAGEFFRSRRGLLASTMTRISHDDKFVREYFYYAVKRWESYLKGQTSGSGIPHVDKEVLGKLEILCLKPEEQTQIASILSTLDLAIEQTEAIIAKQRRIKDGLMQDLLTRGIDEHSVIRSEATHKFKDSLLGRIPVEWEVSAVGTVFTMQLGKMLSKKAVEGKSPFPYLGNKNVQWDYVDLSELLEMDFTEQERRKFNLKEDDILVCEGGEVGRTAMWRGEHEDCYFQKAIHRLRPISDQYLPGLFPRFMRHAISQGLLLNFTSQTSIAHLTQEQLATLPIPVPKIDEQTRIVNAFNHLDKNLCLEETSLNKMRSLKTGLMHDLLTGKVRVNLPPLPGRPSPTEGRGSKNSLMGVAWWRVKYCGNLKTMD